MWWPRLIMLVTFETECCHPILPTLHSCTFAYADLPRLITKFISTIKLDIWEESGTQKKKLCCCHHSDLWWETLKSIILNKAYLGCTVTTIMTILHWKAWCVVFWPALRACCCSLATPVEGQNAHSLCSQFQTRSDTICLSFLLLSSIACSKTANRQLICFQRNASTDVFRGWWKQKGRRKS